MKISGVNMHILLLFVALLLESHSIYAQTLGDVILKIQLINPLPVSREDELILIPVSSLLQRNPAFDKTNFWIKSAGDTIPYEITSGNEIALVLNFTLNEEKELVFLEGRVSNSNLRKRTQAYLGKKLNYKYADKYYTGGEYVVVVEDKVPADHFPHNGLYQYEGPGWESERVAYRFYLDERNRTDIFGKKTENLIVDKIGKNDLISDGKESYTKMNEWGEDIFKVGSSLGMGSLAAEVNGKIMTISKCDSILCHINNHQSFSTVTTDYYGWLIDNDAVNISVTHSINAGNRLTKVSASLSKNIPYLVTGLAKSDKTEYFQSEKENGSTWGYIAIWGKQALSGDELGLCIFYQEDRLYSIAEDELNRIVKLKLPKNEIIYYFGAAWIQEPNGIKTKEDFTKYLNKTRRLLSYPIDIVFDSSIGR